MTDSNHFAGAGVAPAFLNSPAKIAAKMATEAKPPPDVLVLTARMSRGDEAAFREFYQRYFNRLLRYLIVVAGGREEIAREALQAACVRVARHVRRFDSESAFWNWLAMLARHCAVDEMRKRNRHQEFARAIFPATAGRCGCEKPGCGRALFGIGAGRTGEPARRRTRAARTEVS